MLFTGLAEIAGAIGLVWSRTRRLAGLPQAAWYYRVRLPFQPLAILWALYASELLSLRKLQGLSRGGWRA